MTICSIPSSLESDRKEKEEAHNLQYWSICDGSMENENYNKFFLMMVKTFG